MQNGNRTITLYYKALAIQQHQRYNVDSWFPGLENLDDWETFNNLTVEHELQYFAYFQDEFVRRIDMPQTKGALYVENCESVFMCFYAGDTYSYFGDEEEFMKNTSLIHPLHNTTVSHNKFNGNSANMQL